MQLPSLHLLLHLLFFFFQTINSSPFSDCTPLSYTCGSRSFNISYPFRLPDRPNNCGYPGYFVNCTGDNSTLTILNNNKNFQVTSIDYVNSLLNIVDTDLLQQSCPDQSYTNTSIDTSLFQYSDRNRYVTLYFKCSTPYTLPGLFDIACLAGQHAYYRLDNNTMDYLLGSCSSTVVVPLGQAAAEDLSNGNLGLSDALQQGFFVRWVAGGDWCGGCMASGGYCGLNDSDDRQHTCFCPNGTFIGTCDVGVGGGLDPHTRRVIIGVVCGIGGFLLASAICFFCYKRKLKQHLRSAAIPVQNVTSKSFSKVLESISFHGQTPLFSYEELVEATNGFDASRELGDGGYGVVYKGVLRDGRVVAVKRLYETSYKRIEQFMNEVDILSRLRHPNLVTLYGSTSPNSSHLLLVYEFVPNGTLADHLHNPHKSKSLPLSLRLKMAIDTASSLAYLHSIDVIHRDVKSNNILVDDNFNVKVADFGLSRLFPPNATHVSTAPQGTPGYLDPEYHRFYQLTDKSDVYSFGVVLMELISSRPAVDTDRKLNEVSLAMAAVSKIQKGDLGQLVDPGLGFDSDREANSVLTKMAGLAFRCLQMDREMRPLIKEVLEELKEIENSICCNGEEWEKMIKEEDRLLKNSAPTSPDSVMNNWQSRTTTPNTSGQV